MIVQKTIPSVTYKSSKVDEQTLILLIIFFCPGHPINFAGIRTWYHHDTIILILWTNKKYCFSFEKLVFSIWYVHLQSTVTVEYADCIAAER